MFFVNVRLVDNVFCEYEAGGQCFFVNARLVDNVFCECEAGGQCFL